MELLALLWIPILALLLFFVLVSLFQWLWNITIPELFELQPISYWQAFRLLLIGSMLFGGGSFVGFGFGG